MLYLLIGLTVLNNHHHNQHHHHHHQHYKNIQTPIHTPPIVLMRCEAGILCRPPVKCYTKLKRNPNRVLLLVLLLPVVIAFNIINDS